MNRRLVVLGVGLVASTAWCCATVDLDSAEVKAAVSAEQAVIVYDPATQTEHFIRAARFRTGGQSFGFIVPTPTAPTFGEVDDGVFDALAAAHERLRPVVTRPDFSPFLVRSLSKGVDATSLSALQVLSHQRVAGLDVTVVQAGDPQALEAWLTAHHFAMRPALAQWLAHYVAKGFVFSAFRYEPGEDAHELSSKAVRISFKTPTPFYPYREPSDVARRHGPLLVWFIAPEARAWHDGLPPSPPEGERVGERGDAPSVAEASSQRPTPLLRTSKLEVPAELAALLPGTTPWVTLFEDERRTRPAADVEFLPETAPELLPPPRIKRVHLPGDLLCVAFGFMVVIVLAARRKRGAR